MSEQETTRNADEIQARLEAARLAYLDDNQGDDESDENYDERQRLAKEAYESAAMVVWNAFAAEYNGLMMRWPAVQLDWGCGCCSQGETVAGIRPWSGMDLGDSAANAAGILARWRERAAR